MSLRIAAVQVRFLPAYTDGGIDYLAAPLTTAPRLADPASAAHLRRWRESLRTSYCEHHTRKLERIVDHCASIGCNLVVFPEYGVPLECLNRLRQLSFERGIAILAGSFRVDRYHPLLPNVLPELELERMHGRAVATLLDRGRASFTTKLNPSQYDPAIRGDGEPITNTQPLVVRNCPFRLWICSDYLAAPAGELGDLLTIVMSYTPALGDFVVRMQDTTLVGIASKASRAQKSMLGVVFVNNADRGGSKTFFQNREFAATSPEAHDGTWGECDIVDSQVRKCGLPAGSEGIVITDVAPDAQPTERFKQHAVIPIVCCTGPSDKDVGLIAEFLDGYGLSGSLQESIDLLRFRLPGLRSAAGSLGHSLLVSLVSHLETHLDAIDEKQLLDRLTSICLVHEDAPSLDAWLYRASVATQQVLRELSSRPTDGAIDEAIANCSATLRGLGGTRELQRSGAAISQVIGSVSPEDWLNLSGPIQRGVASSRSGSGAIVAGVQLIRHLLQSHNLAEAQRTIAQIQDLRSYLALHILDDLRTVLLSERPNVTQGIDVCHAFLRDRQSERIRLASVCEEFGPQIQGPIVAYGFSDVALTLLETLSPPKPVIFVPECRNRSHVESAVAYVEAIVALGFPVTYVSDATLASLLYRRPDPIRTVLMGFTLAGPDGVINTVGSLGAAMLARHTGADVVFVGQSFKIVEGLDWATLKKKSLESKGDALWLDEAARHRLAADHIADPKSDLVPWEFVSRFVTENGVQTGATMRDRLR